MNPPIFEKYDYRFFFFSPEEQRVHVHVISGAGEAKFWLVPEVRLAKNYRHSDGQLRRIESLIGDHYDELISAWERYFDG